MTFPGGEPGGNTGGPIDGGSSEPVQPPAGAEQPLPGYSDASAYDGAYGQPYETDYEPAGRSGTNTMAIASLVTSAVGFTPYFGGVLAIVGIVLGTVALNQIKETPQDGYGLAVAGIVVGVATLIIGLIWTIFAIR